MQIFGDANITHLQDTAWVDPEVEAHDVRDGNLTRYYRERNGGCKHHGYLYTYTVDALTRQALPAPSMWESKLCHRAQLHCEFPNDLGGTGHLYDGAK